MRTYWLYRAYNSELEVVDGVTVGETFAKVALDLRQQGLAVIRADMVTVSQYRAHLRLQKMKAIMSQEATRQKPAPPIHRRVIERIAAFFRSINARVRTRQPKNP